MTTIIGISEKQIAYAEKIRTKIFKNLPILEEEVFEDGTDKEQKRFTEMKALFESLRTAQAIIETGDLRLDDYIFDYPNTNRKYQVSIYNNIIQLEQKYNK